MNMRTMAIVARRRSAMRMLFKSLRCNIGRALAMTVIQARAADAIFRKNIGSIPVQFVADFLVRCR